MAQKELCDFPSFPLKKGRHIYLWQRETLTKGWAKEGQGIAKNLEGRIVFEIQVIAAVPL